MIRLFPKGMTKFFYSKMSKLSPQQMKFSLLLMLLLSILLRLYLMLVIRRNPAVDEMWTYFLTSASFRDIWFGTLAELHPPFYFGALHALSLIYPFKFNITFLRSISLFFGILSNISIFYLASEVLGKRVGVIAFCLSLFLPSFFWPSVFIRYYSFLIFLTALAMVFFIRLIKTYKLKYLVFLCLISIIGIYTHYYFFLLDISFLSFLFLLKKNALLKKCILSMVVISFFVTPELYFLFTLPKPEVLGLTNDFLKIPAAIISNITSWELLVYLYHKGNALFYLPIFAILGITTMILLVYGFKNWRNELRVLFFFVVFIPPLLAGFISLFKPLFGLGSFQIFLPSFVVVLANGISYDLKKTRILSIIFICSVFFSLILFFQASTAYATFREDYVTILNKFKRGDLVLHSHLYSFIPGRYYLGDEVNFALMHTSSSTLQTEQALGYKIIPQNLLLYHKGRIWYLEQPNGESIEAKKTKTLLDENFTLVESYKFSPFLFNVYLYTSK